MYRVVWQYDSKALGGFSELSLPGVADLIDQQPTLFADLPLIGEVEPVFSQPKLRLRGERLTLPSDLQEDPDLDLAGYHHAFMDREEDCQRLLSRLLDANGVRFAEIQPPLVPAVRFWSDEKSPPQTVTPASLSPTKSLFLESEQRYLAPAPVGIDARAAWSLPGGRGQDVRIVDVENGWNFSHEDLRLLQGGVVHGQNTNDDHGTAVLGIFSGDWNGFGITGIASEAIAFASAARYEPTQMKWNAAEAIKKAADRLRAGDIILLEMHGPGPNTPRPDPGNQKGYVPVEFWQSEFAAIKAATARGIYVIEAAGNGGEDLDAAVYGGKFDRHSRDSGAIFVGGGGSSFSPAPRARWFWSNFGSRLDVQGWGDSIVTAGGRSEPHYADRVFDIDPSRCYTKSFGGTSGASPVIVGVVAAITGCLRAADRPLPSPVQMRELLEQTGTPQSDVAGPSGKFTRIGPLPDLRHALGRLGLV